MNVLKPVALGSGTALAALVAESLTGIEPGLSLLERHFTDRDVRVDLLAVDARRHLVVVVVDLEVDAVTVVRALEATVWCQEHATLLARMFARADVDPVAEPRTILVASRFSDRSMRALRTLGAAAPSAVECRAFELGGERCVSYTAVGEPTRRGDRTPDAPVVERTPVPPAVAEVGTELVPAPTESTRDAEPAATERAQSLIARLEALRFRQAFPG